MWILLLTILASICSLFLLTGCSSSGLDRPDANATWINASGLKTESYNLLKDYDNDGNRLPDAKPTVAKYATAQEMLRQMNVWVCFDVASQKEIKAKLDEANQYIKLLKDKCGSSCWGL